MVSGGARSSGKTVIIQPEDIASLLDPKEALRAIAEGFVADALGKAQMGTALLRFGDAAGVCVAKPGYIEGQGEFVIKEACFFSGNRTAGLPSIHGSFIVRSATTGELLAWINDGGLLTSLRTAYAGRIVARHLCPTAVDAIGIIGTGAQARLQLQEIGDETGCRRALVYGRTQTNVARFIDEMKGFDVTAMASAEQVASQSNVVVMTTASTHALVQGQWLRPGALVIDVGADKPGKQELDPSVFARAACVVVDSREQCAQMGDSAHAIRAGVVAPSQMVLIGDVIRGAVSARATSDDIVVADLTGVGVQDAAIARTVYRAARDRAPGQGPLAPQHQNHESSPRE